MITPTYIKKAEEISRDEDFSLGEKIQQILEIIAINKDADPTKVAIYRLYEVIHQLMVEANENGQFNEDVIRAKCMLAEFNDKSGRYFANSVLAKESLEIIDQMNDDSDHLILKSEVLSRFIELTKNHPRLYVSLVNKYMDVASQIDEPSEREMQRRDAFENKAREIKEAIGLVEHSDVPFIQLASSSLRQDPIEYTQKWEDIIDEIEEKAFEQTKYEARGMGFCYHYWCVILMELQKRGIKWRTPQTMNPGVNFD